MALHLATALAVVLLLGALAFALAPLFLGGSVRARTTFLGGSVRARTTAALFLLAPLAAWGVSALPLQADAPLAARLDAPLESLPLDGAVARLAAHVRAHPRDQEGWTLLARARYAKGDYPRSAQAWQRALSLSEDKTARARAHLGLAESLLQSEDGIITDDAAEHLRAASKLDANLAEPHYFLGEWARQNGERAAAQKHWQRALNLWQDNPRRSAWLQRRLLTLQQDGAPQ